MEESYTLAAAAPLLAISLALAATISVGLFFEADIVTLVSKLFGVGLAWMSGLFFFAFLAAVIARIFDSNDPNFGLAGVLMLVALLSVGATYWIVSRNMRISAGATIEKAYVFDLGGMLDDYIDILGDLAGD
jgi:hypothetical protein